MKVLKSIFDVICRVLALFYAVTIIPVMFLLGTLLVTAAFLLGAVEWVFRGDAPWCNAAIEWVVEDAWQFILNIFRKLAR